MSQTFTLPKSLVEDLDALRHDLGFKDVEVAIRYLLKNAIVREKKLLVARLYQNKKKTLRQCAELLNVDLEEMIDVLREFSIPFHHDDIAEQLETVKKLARQQQATTT